MPDPADVEGNAGDLTIDNTTVSWVGWIPASEDDEDTTKALLYDDIKIDNDAVVNVTGDLRIICKTLTVDHRSTINLAPDANLTFFVTETDQDVKIKDESLVNVAATSADGVDSGIVTINYLGNKHVKIEKKTHAYLIVVAPDGELEVKDNAHIYGSFLGKKLTLDKDSGFHVDLSNGDDGMYNPAILVRDKLEFEDKVVVDHFDSLLGAYDGPDGGGTNYGDSALLQTNSIKKEKIKIKGDSMVEADVVVGVGGDPATVVKVDGGGVLTGTQNSLATPLPIPVVTPPAMSVPFLGDVEYKSTTVTLATDLHCKKLKLEKAVLNIAGTVTIRCDDKLEMKDKAEIQLLPGARLTIYVKKEVKIEDRCLINSTTGDPKLVSIRRMSLGKKGVIEIKKSCEVHAWIQGAKTELKLEDKSKLFGNFMGEKAKIKGSAELHVDMAYLITCVDIDDTPGLQGVNSNGGISSSISFSEWFRDVAGVNQSAVHTITMINNGSGIFEHIDDDFRPIDDRLLGNEGDTNNHYFTYAVAADFTYSDCGGQFIQFSGGDGAWLFVDGRLVMDLGGMDSSEKQYVDFDRIGLAGGESYRLHFFYASRRPDSTDFKLRTNIELSTARAIPVVSAAYD
jgi:fibro-slime domain-containing protein